MSYYRDRDVCIEIEFKEVRYILQRVQNMWTLRVYGGRFTHSNIINLPQDPFFYSIAEDWLPCVPSSYRPVVVCVVNDFISTFINVMRDWVRSSTSLSQLEWRANYAETFFDLYVYMDIKEVRLGLNN